MCGIAGKVSNREPVPRALIERMCQSVEHRGPDARGLFLEDGVGLGIQRLAIIDLQSGNQPIFNEDRSLVIVFNGEIYNFDELRTALIARGHRFTTASDTEVILHLYEERGRQCVEELRGMFALAIWDRRRRCLLLARDRVGKKPLFYSAGDGSLWFGSETKAILQDPVVDRAVDYEAIDSYLQYQYVPHPRSAFDAIKKLPPGYTLSWNDGRVELQRYWKLSYRTPAATVSEATAAEAIREGLLEATRVRLRSDVPLGAFLSGGVDSSAVVAAMSEVATGTIKTFTAGFDEPEFDERQRARRVARLFATEHHEFQIQANAIEILPRLVWHYGEPFADHSAIPSFYLAALTREHVTVALNGDGGDENFGGYTRYFGNRLAQSLTRVPRGLTAATAALARRMGPGSTQGTLRHRLRLLATTISLPAAVRYAAWIAYFTARERDDLYTPEFRETLGPGSADSVISGPYFDSDAEDFTERLLDVDVQTYLPGDLLVKIDIATMAHSLEARSPLLDHVFMELVAGLPASVKFRGWGSSKHLFKRALSPWLPQAVLTGKKKGFSVPLAKWFRGPLKDLPNEVLLDPTCLDRGLFRPESVRRIIADHVAGRADNANKLWGLLQLELWMRSYVDRPPERPPSNIPTAALATASATRRSYA